MQARSTGNRRPFRLGAKAAAGRGRVLHARPRMPLARRLSRLPPPRAGKPTILFKQKEEEYEDRGLSYEGEGMQRVYENEKWNGRRKKLQARQRHQEYRRAERTTKATSCSF
jgi:hypothetical protein